MAPALLSRARRPGLGAPWARLTAADLLTASRIPAAAVLLAARPRAGIAVVIVAWAWVSDALDGPLARSAGGAGRLGRVDHLVDAAVGVAIAWYLGAVGFLPAGPSRVVAGALVVVWLLTGVFQLQMLLQALAYGAFVWWAVVTPAPAWWLLPLVALAILAAEWRRFAEELVPRFLFGWRDRGR